MWAARRFRPLRSRVRNLATYRVLRAWLEPPPASIQGGVRVPKDRSVANAQAAAAFGAERGFRVLFASQAYIPDGQRAPASPAPAACAWRAIEPSVDVCGLFAADGDQAGRYFVDTMHATAEGHRRIAEAIAARLRELGWLTEAEGAPSPAAETL